MSIDEINEKRKAWGQIALQGRGERYHKSVAVSVGTKATKKRATQSTALDFGSGIRLGGEL